MIKKRVLVVDDSAFMRKMISDIIRLSDSLECVDTARNGEDALKKLEKWKPDVITLDVEMPIMDGITTLSEIMRIKPTPVVMLSSLTKSGADKTIEALSLGAVDVIAKPSGSISLDIKNIETEIIQKVENAANANVKLTNRRPSQLVTDHYKPIQSDKPIVAIGSSTGGPRALQQVITKLPADFHAPVVIVQHMPKGFTKSLAERLDKLSALPVNEVEDQDVIKKGKVYLAPGGKHFRIIRKGQQMVASVRQEEPVKGHQPSVDVLFDSIANLKNCHPIAVVLTGMGSDGSKGIIQLKRHHPKTIAISQSEATCVVYGMPQAAEKTSLVDYVHNIEDIHKVLVQKIPKKR
ncbi:chemotaxis response regulator protein-glutamate methylesterase [Gracilibacillus caseinilyticus]|uniref:Protein-glutamate methylesterase/protein-glutamine glutaminase n=1 Tax=Gracilibacillus caseinilyticus TaxID=2932256 RepID=A0ABY4ETW6_9BACI|nr:chemotaxis response regulator protein-glutamate methylesterase [Gracilibacillus caseinilyticus]UOQ47857.1 chemotaxis response regulator protein-glutamate methylesterase [Gracilibacillus caseinilyticus]